MLVNEKPTRPSHKFLYSEKGEYTFHVLLKGDEINKDLTGMFDMIMNLQKKYNEKYIYTTNINPYSSRTLQKTSWKNIKLDDIIKINDMTSQYKSWNNKTVLNIGIALSIFYWIFITVIVFSTIILLVSFFYLY